MHINLAYVLTEIVSQKTSLKIRKVEEYKQKRLTF